MARSELTPTFTPWDGEEMVLRHHDHRERVGRIAKLNSRWHLSWEESRVGDSLHASSLEAVAAACEAYPRYVEAEDEEMREDREREEYEERFYRRRAQAVARAVSVPTGGQKGWKAQRSGDPD
ncbi:hypothetical protein [Streptomyces sp. KR2]|uniref:hypothetical protein n=1 Tax=Streptomyces sp. KR2 TaxID=1514824 RepID=UPI003F7FCE44